MATVRKDGSITFIGNEGVWQTEPLVTEGDPWTGLVTRTGYAGPKDQIDSLFFQFLASGWSVRRATKQADSGTSYSELSVSRADDFIPPVQWKIKNVSTQRNLLEANEVPMISQLTSETKANIEKRLKNPDSVKNLTPGTAPDIDDAAHKTLALLQAGVETKIISSAEVTRVQVVPNGWVPDAAWLRTYIDEVISTSTLISYFGVPSYLQGILPGVGATIQTDQDHLTKVYGWLVSGIDYDPALKARTTIGQTFKFGQWSIQPNGEYVFAG